MTILLDVLLEIFREKENHINQNQGLHTRNKELQRKECINIKKFFLIHN